MQKTKLYRLLSELSNPELNRLVKFAQSPYHNPNPVISRCIQRLIEVIRQDVSLSREELSLFLGDGHPLEDQRFRKICSDCLQLTIHFLAVEKFSLDQPLEQATRLDVIVQRRYEFLFRSSRQKLASTLDRLPGRGASYYLHQYRLQEYIYEMSQYQLQRFEVANIEEIIGNLDAFYTIEKLRYYCEILSRKTFTKHEYSNILIQELLDLVRKGKFSKHPVIEIYYLIVLTHLEPHAEQHYYDLKEKLHNHAHYLPADQMKQLYDSALNYCNRKINSGKSKFMAESFELYKTVLANELIYVDGFITHWTFKNVIVLALRLGEFDWAERFVEKYSYRIEENFRENAVTYNQAQICFYRKDFHQVISKLQTVEYQDITYNLGAKSMLLATYYELSEWDALESLSASFKVYLTRRKNTIPEARRKSYINMIKVISKLVDYRNRNRLSVKSISNYLGQLEVVASEPWLREKLKELQSQPAGF